MLVRIEKSRCLQKKVRSRSPVPRSNHYKQAEQSTKCTAQKLTSWMSSMALGLRGPRTFRKSRSRFETEMRTCYRTQSVHGDTKNAAHSHDRGLRRRRITSLHPMQQFFEISAQKLLFARQAKRVAAHVHTHEFLLVFQIRTFGLCTFVS